MKDSLKGIGEILLCMLFGAVITYFVLWQFDRTHPIPPQITKKVEREIPVLDWRGK